MRRILLLALASTPSWADPAELHRHDTRFSAAQLIESADGDLKRAALIYEELAKLEGQETAEIRQRALLALGRLRLNQGDVQGAREAFWDCRQISTSGVGQRDRHECLLEARKVEVRASAVKTIPTKWTFDDKNHGFVHIGTLDSVSLHEGSLIWRHEAQNAAELLVVGFDTASASPKGVRITWRAEGTQPVLAIVVTDRAGNVYWEPRTVTVGATTRIMELRFEDFTPGHESVPPLDVASIQQLQLHDFTYERQATSQAAAHSIIIDAFEVY